MKNENEQTVLRLPSTTLREQLSNRNAEQRRIAVCERSRTVRTARGVEVDKICEVCEVGRE